LCQSQIQYSRAADKWKHPSSTPTCLIMRPELVDRVDQTSLTNRLTSHAESAADNLDDGGYRLASLIDVDVASLDRHQLTRLMLAALGHVQARLPHGADGQDATADRGLGSACQNPSCQLTLSQLRSLYGQPF
jgi:hypothetical protein